MNFKKYSLYIGLNDKDLLKQIKTMKEYKKIINDELLKNNINAYSIYNVNGVFTNNDKITTIEKTLKIEILNNDILKDDIIKIINNLKIKLNQESIMLEYEVKKVNFI